MAKTHKKTLLHCVWYKTIYTFISISISIYLIDAVRHVFVTANKQ